MARVTVEDCVLKVPNRFNLVLYAAQRARDISSGAPETLDRDNDKNPVVALREIADDTLELTSLQESLILGLQKHHPSDDYEDDPEAMESLDQDATILGAGAGPGDDAPHRSAADDTEEEEDDSENDENENEGDAEPAATDDQED